VAGGQLAPVINEKLIKNDMQHGAIKMFFFGTYADKIEFWKIS
jgi:hypothetical protein